MKRPWLIPLALLVLLAGLAWLASTRLTAALSGPAGELQAAATVRSDIVSVLAPSLAASRTPSAGGQPAVAGLLASVEVSAGTRVAAGDVVARLDDRALAIQVEVAKAGARGARANIGVLDANLDTVADGAVKLADAKKTLDAALKKLRTTRSGVLANLAKARAAAAMLPPGWTPPPGVPDPRILVVQLGAALKQIDAGLAKAIAGRTKLHTAAARITDARSTLRGVRRVLVLAVDASDAGIRVAEARRDLAVLRAPCAGVVTWAAETGTVAFAGGPVARILPDGPILVDTYLDAEQAKLVVVGSTARAGSDSHPSATFPGRVTALFPVYEYPPTSLPTTLIHMTRAFRVTVTLDDTAAPMPPGTPADLTISTRSGS
jgi:HlyD family secretion protein